MFAGGILPQTLIKKLFKKYVYDQFAFKSFCITAKSVVKSSSNDW